MLFRSIPYDLEQQRKESKEFLDDLTIRDQRMMFAAVSYTHLDNVARQAVDEAISKSFTLKDFDRQLAEMGYRINFDPNRKYCLLYTSRGESPC